MNQGLFRVSEMLVQNLLVFRVALRFIYVYICLSRCGFGFNYLGLRLLKVSGFLKVGLSSI